MGQTSSVPIESGDGIEAHTAIRSGNVGERKVIWRYPGHPIHQLSGQLTPCRQKGGVTYSEASEQGVGNPEVAEHSPKTVQEVPVSTDSPTIQYLSLFFGKDKGSIEGESG